MSELPPADNRFPNLVTLKLSTQPLVQESPFGSIPSEDSSQSIDLKMTLRFGCQKFSFPSGEVLVYLKCGELKLKLTNGKIPLEKMGLVAPFEPIIEVKQQQVRGRKTEMTVAVPAGIKTEEVSQQTTEVEFQASKIRNRGTEIAPIWEFMADFEPPYLIGQLTNSSLGEVKINSHPCSVQATFTVSDHKDLYLEGKGLWPKDLSRNKLAILERAFFRRFIEPKLHPYLSQVEGQL
jgi:hypothetical protein